MMLASTDRETLAQIPARFANGWNRKDVDAAFADYADDADFVNVFGLWWHGKEQIVKEHADRFGSVFRDTTLSFNHVSVRDIPPNAAVIHGKWVLTGLHAPDGSAAPDRSGILIFVAERRTDGWKIVASQNTDIVSG